MSPVDFDKTEKTACNLISRGEGHVDLSREHHQNDRGRELPRRGFLYCFHSSCRHQESGSQPSCQQLPRFEPSLRDKVLPPRPAALALVAVLSLNF